MALDLRESELEHKFIKEHVNNVEKHFEEIISKLNYYIDKLVNLGDSGADVAKSISNFASKENCNQTLRVKLEEFSDVFASIQKYRDAQVYRTSVKVIHELENFKPLCKETKAYIKKCYDARVKELKKKNALEKSRSKTPPNRQKIAQAEKDVNQAEAEALHTTQEMGKIVERFERKKLEDLQCIFLEFIKIEMIFHAKAIELNTKAYNILKSIKVEQDLHEFNSHFKAHTSSLDAQALYPINHDSIPKTVDANVQYHSPIYTSQKSQALKADTSSLDCETLSPVSHVTGLEASATVQYLSPTYKSHKSQIHKSSVQGESPRTPFTLKTAVSNTAGSSCSFSPE